MANETSPLSILRVIGLYAGIGAAVCAVVVVAGIIVNTPRICRALQKKSIKQHWRERRTRGRVSGSGQPTSANTPPSTQNGDVELGNMAPLSGAAMPPLQEPKHTARKLRDEVDSDLESLVALEDLKEGRSDGFGMLPSITTRLSER